MKFFDIEEKIIRQSQNPEEFMLFLVDDLESQVSEEVSRFLCLGDEKSIDISFFQKLFDLTPPPFIIEKRMFRIDIDIDSPISGYFFQRFEDLI